MGDSLGRRVARRLFSPESGGQRLLVLVVIAAVAMLILPVPAFLLDFLLTINICFSIILLLLALHVGESLRMASFPTMLLVTTLFRLSLNVSTTRLILLDADAGEVVGAFGRFVVQGNPLVGGIMFLILTVVQFIVIAKGAERVAEVTARFTLDAMPGKQMSIDADLRAGAIDQAEAQRRRIEAEREAQFHGAMDGAMKFVKGDAVAGMVIVVINLLGGLLVGVVQRGMAASEVVSIYTVLTVGDGLVSQIPALLISTAAGLVITRVRSEKTTSSPGKEIVRQVGAHPEVLLAAGVALAVLGLVPGMPTLSFLLLGSGLSVLGAVLRERRRRAEERKEPGPRQTPAAVILQVGAGFCEVPALQNNLEQARADLAREMGITVPAVLVVAEGPVGRWSMWVDDAPVVGGTYGKDGAAVPWPAVERALRRSAARFVGVQETQDMLDRLERLQPALVREVVPRLVPPVLLAEILARLVEEEVPVRNLRGILVVLAEAARSEADPAQLVERVRQELRGVISNRVAPEGTLRALLLDPEVEHVLEHSLQRTAASTTLALAPKDGEAIIQSLDRIVKSQGSTAVVVLTRPELRRPLWKLANSMQLAVTVVSFFELEPTILVQAAGAIRLSPA